MTDSAGVSPGAPKRTVGGSTLLFSSLHGYSRSWLRGDVTAGLTVWAVLVPEALAYASIAGVSPVVGLYAAPAALLLYAAFGSSRHLIVGPMSATAALSAASVAELSPTGASAYVALTATLAIVAGLVAIAAGLMRLGFIANFISEPVLKGFIVGLALTIIVGQLPKLFGVPKGEGNAFQKLWSLVSDLGATSGLTVVVGACSLGVVVLLRRVAPAVPGSLVAVGLGIVAVALLHLDRHGVAIVGHIDGGLPPLATPDVTAHQYLQLVPAGIGVVLVGFAEGLGAAKTYAARAHYEIDPNRELLGLGAANLGAGLSSGMVVNGSLSKTAVNGGAGANSQVSGLIVGALTLVTLVLLTGLFGKLPEATLAAVVIVAVSELVDVAALRRLYRVTTNDKRIPRLVSRPDFIGAFTALAGVLLFDTLPGLAIGVGVSFLLLLYRTSHPRISRLGEVPPATGQYTDLERHPNDVTSIGVAILRVEGGIFFANAEAVRAAIRAAATRSTRAVVLDAETISFLDVTGARMLEDVAMDLAREHVRLVIAHGVADVRRGLRVGGADGNAIELYSTVQSAVAAYT